MAGIDGHGRDDRVDFPFKEAFQPQPLVIVKGIDTDEVQAVSLQLLLDIFIVAVLVADQLWTMDWMASNCSCGVMPAM